MSCLRKGCSVEELHGHGRSGEPLFDPPMTTHDKSKAEIEHVIESAYQDMQGVMTGRKGYRLRREELTDYLLTLITAAEQRGRAAELRRVYQAVKDMEHAYNNGAGRTLSKGEIIKWLEFELGIGTGRNG